MHTHLVCAHHLGSNVFLPVDAQVSWIYHPCSLGLLCYRYSTFPLLLCSLTGPSRPGTGEGRGVGVGDITSREELVTEGITSDDRISPSITEAAFRELIQRSQFPFNFCKHLC